MACRTRPKDLEALGGEWVPLPDLEGEVDWLPALEGMDAVVHLAGIAHRFESNVSSDWGLYDRVKHLATRSLVSAIRKHATVQRFLFMSTVRVHGNSVNLPLVPASPLEPGTPYEQSKVDAEIAVREVLGPTPITWAILRPVLVYGPGHRGNMARLESLLRLGLPVPVGRTPNRRSFLYIGNLVSVIQTYLTIPDPPAGGTWMVADDEVVSTEALVRAMAEAMKLPARVVRLPYWWLAWTARIGDRCRRLGLSVPWNSEVNAKLLGDFFVNIELTKQDLGWKPPFSLQAGIRHTFGG
jgi:nucleoside-diphosphate-sugar epimerase